MDKISNTEYNSWLKEVKRKILKSQIKDSITINIELLRLYWDLGKDISAKINNSNWGSGIVDKLSKDLNKHFPNMKGFSRSNLFSMRQWYDFYSIINENFDKIQQLVGKIPWGHNVLKISKVNDLNEAQFYINKTIENNWSRSILKLQIESNLFTILFWRYSGEDKTR